MSDAKILKFAKTKSVYRTQKNVIEAKKFSDITPTKQKLLREQYAKRVAKKKVAKKKPATPKPKEKELKDMSVATLNLIIKHYNKSSFNVHGSDKSYLSAKKNAKTKSEKIDFIEWYVDSPDATMKSMRRTWSDFLPEKVGWWHLKD
jgi:ABC-type Fe3+/spermidine/putrescine transport system ATPase subunit